MEGPSLDTDQGHERGRQPGQEQVAQIPGDQTERPRRATGGSSRRASRATTADEVRRRPAPGRRTGSVAAGRRCTRGARGRRPGDRSGSRSFPSPCRTARRPYSRRTLTPAGVASSTATMPDREHAGRLLEVAAEDEHGAGDREPETDQAHRHRSSRVTRFRRGRFERAETATGGRFAGPDGGRGGAAHRCRGPLPVRRPGTRG